MGGMKRPDMSKYVPINSANRKSDGSPPPQRTDLGKNPFLRCTIPQAVATDSDSLRQFYQAGIPQYRIIPPIPGGTRPQST